MKNRFFQRALPVLTGVILIGAGARARLQAYPPAPHHEIYGMVRNEMGEPLDFTAAEVYVVATNNVLVRAVVAPSTDPGINYRLKVPMDANTAQDLYSPEVMKQNQSFRLRVRIGQTTYLPIEMILNPVPLGQPARSTRLDLTLGEDSDQDGLPDAWEQALIAIYGGTLASINPNDDTDGDGISNYNEYLAGTYAFDPSDGFMLNIVSSTGDTAVLEFLAVRGRTYSIESKTDFTQQWLPTQFRLNAFGENPLLTAYSATNTVWLQIQVPATGPASNRRFYRAKVQ